MLKRYGNSYIDADAITGITKTSFEDRGNTVYQLNIIIRGMGNILVGYESENDRSRALEEILKDNAESATITAGVKETTPMYVEGFKDGVKCALELRR